MPEFEPDAEIGANLAARWTTWLSDFEIFLTASGITNNTRRRALLLYQAGPRVREILQPIPNTGDADDYSTAKAKLTAHFEPQKNRRYEVFKFREAKQDADMPKTPFEKLQLERKQLRRSFTKTYNEASSLFKKDRLLNEEITFLKTAAAALQEQLKECQNLDKEIRIVALDEIEDEDESDAFFDEVTETQNQPPSRTNTHTAIITNESSTASSAPENVSTANSTSQPITTNCAPLLNIDINDRLDDNPPYPSLHINDKSSYVNRTAKLKPPQSTNAPSEAVNQQIILKTAKAVAIANDKKSNANIFFDEGSQRSYVRAEFANQLGLNPESYELLSVSGFGGTITKRNYGVSTLGLETTSDVELIRVLFSDEIVKPINQSGCYNLKNDSRFKKLEFANNFSDEHFQVDILIGADAAYRFLGAIDNQFQAPFIQKSKFGLVISGPFPKPIPEMGNPAVSEEITSIHTNAAKSVNEVDVNSDKSFTSPLSLENLVDNAELSVQFEKILQHQSLNYDNDKKKANAFIHDYQQRVEF
eukprot:gene6385-biopygen5284